MGMNIGEIGKLCAPLWNVVEIERRTEFDVKNEAGKRDSYISSVSSSELFHSTGNYDEQGQMDDDFSVNMGNENEVASQTMLYSREYAEQTLKMTAKTENSNNEMHRNR